MYVQKKEEEKTLILSMLFRSGSLRVNYTVVALDTAVSGQEFAQATNDLANGTAVSVFGTSTKVTEMAVNKVDGNYVS